MKNEPFVGNGRDGPFPEPYPFPTSLCSVLLYPVAPIPCPTSLCRVLSCHAHRRPWCGDGGGDGKVAEAGVDRVVNKPLWGMGRRAHSMTLPCVVSFRATRTVVVVEGVVDCGWE